MDRRTLRPQQTSPIPTRSIRMTTTSEATAQLATTEPIRIPVLPPPPAAHRPSLTNSAASSLLYPAAHVHTLAEDAGVSGDGSAGRIRNFATMGETQFGVAPISPVSPQRSTAAAAAAPLLQGPTHPRSLSEGTGVALVLHQPEATWPLIPVPESQGT